MYISRFYSLNRVNLIVPSQVLVDDNSKVFHRRYAFYMRRERNKDIICPITEQSRNQYFEKLLTEDRKEFQITDNNTNITTQGSPVRISVSEVKKSVNALKNGRAAGPGNIPEELIKYGTEKLTQMLTNLLQRCINKSEVPKEWKCHTYL